MLKLAILDLPIGALIPAWRHEPAPTVFVEERVRQDFARSSLPRMTVPLKTSRRWQRLQQRIESNCCAMPSILVEGARLKPTSTTS